jgi:DNA-dependent RNA polymerase
MYGGFGERQSKSRGEGLIGSRQLVRMLTVNAAVSEGITSMATVHDSFGCLASQAERFREIIREESVMLYQEHDVLSKVLECARMDLKALRPCLTSPHRWAPWTSTK